MRIFISGSPGAGKTTYAKKLAQEHAVPLFHTDDLWNNQENRMLTHEEISRAIPLDGNWIIEGAYYLPDYIRQADKVIYFRITPLQAVIRILKRWTQDKKFRATCSFSRLLALLHTTFWGFFLTDHIPSETNIAKHYKERDMFRLISANAKKVEIL